MNYVIKRNIAFLLIALLMACNSPNPTELVLEDNSSGDEVDVEVLTQDPTNDNSFLGYDSTGSFENIEGLASLVSITGTKNTYHGYTINSANAIAAFYDNTKPIYNQKGKLVSYFTMPVGKVWFNGFSAYEKNYDFRFIDKGEMHDVSSGTIYYRSYKHLNDNKFKYNSNLEIKVKGMHNTLDSIIVEIPKEITGRITSSGIPNQKDKKVIVEWNEQRSGKIEIIIGGIVRGKKDPFAMLRLTTKDDGKFVIPKSLLKSIPFDKLDKVIFSLIRRNKTTKNRDNIFGKNHLSAQSIHNLIFDAN